MSMDRPTAPRPLSESERLHELETALDIIYEVGRVLSRSFELRETLSAVLKAMDEEIAKVASEGVSAEELARVKTGMLASWYDGLEAFISRADTLAKLQLLWGDAEVVNKIPAWIDAVTSEDVQRAARTYLASANRTVIDRKPAAMLQAAPAAAPAQPAQPANGND